MKYLMPTYENCSASIWIEMSQYGPSVQQLIPMGSTIAARSRVLNAPEITLWRSDHYRGDHAGNQIFAVERYVKTDRCIAMNSRSDTVSRNSQVVSRLIKSIPTYNDFNDLKRSKLQYLFRFSGGNR